MRICWLNRQGNRDCILFMAGWGMAPEPFNSIPADGVDVLMVYDYTEMAGIDWSAVLADYKNSEKRGRVHLLAWSMGVWVASREFTASTLPLFRSATAVAGTCFPIDDRLGIPCDVFSDTIDTLLPETLTAFYESMFDEELEQRRFLQHRPNRPVEELRQELINLKTRYQQSSATARKDIFQRRIVCKRDRVFPARNQLRAWGRKNCDVFTLPHFPFYQWASWNDLLRELR